MMRLSTAIATKTALLCPSAGSEDLPGSVVRAELTPVCVSRRLPCHARTARTVGMNSADSSFLPCWFSTPLSLLPASLLTFSSYRHDMVLQPPAISPKTPAFTRTCQRSGSQPITFKPRPIRLLNSSRRVRQPSTMDAVNVPSETVPLEMRACEQILKRAKELKKPEPVVAYWCKRTVVKAL